LVARLPLHALVIDSEAGTENLRAHEVIGPPLFTIVYEPTNPEPQSEVLANVAVTGEGTGAPVPVDPVPVEPEPEPVPVPVEPVPPEPVPPVPPVPPVAPEHGCPLSVHWLGATKAPVYAVWNPKVAVPPLARAPFHETFVTV
jgi:protein TonB